MVSIIDALIDAFIQLLVVIIAYFLIFLPSFILSFTVIVIGLLVYRSGRKKNNQIMDYYFEMIRKSSGNRFTKQELAEESTIGRTYLFQVKPDISLEDFRIHFTMIHRHLILSKIVSKFRDRRDYILLEAEPRNKVVKRYQLELLSKQDEKRIKSLIDMLGQLEFFEIGNKKFDEEFIMRVNDSEFFKTVFQTNQQIIKYIFSSKKNIIRISYYPLDRPSIRLVAELDEHFNPERAITILFDLTKAIAVLAEKGYYKKKLASGSRLIKDTTLKEEEPHFP